MLTIGIETECLLSHIPDGNAKEIPSDPEAFAKWFVPIYNKTKKGTFDLANDVDGEYEAPDTARLWLLTDDITIQADQQNQCAIEIVSPLLQYGNRSWRSELQSMFDTVEAHLKVEANKSCGLHVHVSLGKNVHWPLDHVKKLAAAILYFEKAWNLIVPPERRRNPYAKSNRYDNPKLRDFGLDRCLDEIQRCPTNVELADLMNNDGDRYFAWNFLNLWYRGKETIEFRRGPGVCIFRACEAWVALAVAFIQASCNSQSIAEILRYPSNASGLLAFVREGLETGDNTGVETLFCGKTGMVNTSSIGTLTLSELEQLRAKKAKDDKKDRILQKMNSL